MTEIPVQDGEPDVYGALAGLLANHEGGLHAYAALFLTFNGAAIPIVLASSQPEVLKTAISGIGFITHLMLFSMAFREISWIRYIRSLLVRMERMDEATPSGIRIRLFSDSRMVNMAPVRVGLRLGFASTVGVACIFFWLYELIVHYLAYALDLFPF